MKIKVSFSVVSVATYDEDIEYSKEIFEEASEEMEEEVMKMINDYFGSYDDIKTKNEVNDFKIEIIDNKKEIENEKI